MPRIKIPNKILVSTRIVPTQYDALTQMATDKGVTISDIIRVAIDMYMEPTKQFTQYMEDGQ